MVVGMCPEDLDLPPPDEYHQPQRSHLRRWLGKLVARRVAGDAEVEMPSAEELLMQDLNEVASKGLEIAYADAISRAQSLLVALDEHRVPVFLLDDPGLKGAYPDELVAAVKDWSDECAAAISRLRDGAAMCAYFKDAVDNDSKANFCLTVGSAEVGLREDLYERFNRDTPDS